jgi:phosphoribosylglycinamide formyltransferase 2
MAATRASRSSGSCSVEAGALTFAGVDEALKIPGSEIRLFGKPQSFVKRRMGVALARATTTDEARAKAKRAAGSVKPSVYPSQ